MEEKVEPKEEMTEEQMKARWGLFTGGYIADQNFYESLRLRQLLFNLRYMVERWRLPFNAVTLALIVGTYNEKAIQACRELYRGICQEGIQLWPEGEEHWPPPEESLPRYDQ